MSITKWPTLAHRLCFAACTPFKERIKVSSNVEPHVKAISRESVDLGPCQVSLSSIALICARVHLLPCSKAATCFILLHKRRFVLLPLRHLVIRESVIMWQSMVRCRHNQCHWCWILTMFSWMRDDHRCFFSVRGPRWRHWVEVYRRRLQPFEWTCDNGRREWARNEEEEERYSLWDYNDIHGE